MVKLKDKSEGRGIITDLYIIIRSMFDIMDKQDQLLEIFRIENENLQEKLDKSENIKQHLQEKYEGDDNEK